MGVDRFTVFGWFLKQKNAIMFSSWSPNLLGLILPATSDSSRLWSRMHDHFMDVYFTRMGVTLSYTLWRQHEWARKWLFWLLCICKFPSIMRTWNIVLCFRMCQHSSRGNYTYEFWYIIVLDCVILNANAY